MSRKIVVASFIMFFLVGECIVRDVSAISILACLGFAFAMTVITEWELTFWLKTLLNSLVWTIYHYHQAKRKQKDVS